MDALNLIASFDEWRPRNPANAVAALMSGGVDSSVTARLLLEQGREVVGVTMRIPKALGGDQPRPCCGWEAAQICRQLGIAHYFVDTDAAFHALVIEPFRRAYAEGRTPSPCIDCNTALKFGAVRAAIADALGVRNIATGHYATIAQDGSGNWRLGRADDGARDQSYFLYGILREDLPHTLFPLAGVTKDEVRRRARELGLSSAERPDSMELCFAGEGDYRRALGIVPGTGADDDSGAGMACGNANTGCACGAPAAPAGAANNAAIEPGTLRREGGNLIAAGKLSKDERRQLKTIPINEATAGPILDTAGRRLGTHNGIWNFTPGQRKGIGVAAKEPLYVLRLGVPRNAVIVGPRAEAFRTTVAACAVNVLFPPEAREGAELFGRIRNTGTPAPCRIERLEGQGGRIRVRFAEGIFAPAAGQHLVLYNERGQIAAGGVICTDDE